MALFNLPLVREDDYQVLAKIIHPHLPATYAGWLTLCAELERPHWKHDIFYVEVKPENFAEYMANAKHELDLKALLDFVAFNPWHDPD